MRKRILALLLAAVVLMVLCAPVLAEAPAETPAPTLEPTKVPEGTVVPTAEPIETPEETVVPTLEPTEVPEETVVPTGEPTEVPEETVVPTGEPTETPEPDGEIMLTAAEADVEFTLNMTNVTLKSGRRTVTLKVKMEPYDPAWRKIEWESSRPDVVTVERLNDPTAAADGQAKLTPKGPGTATIKVTAVDSPTKWSAECTVTVSRDSTTWGMTLDQVKAMGVESASRLDVYDGRDLGIMSPVNYQRGNICVAEGHVTAMETALLYQGLFHDPNAVDMDSHHLAYNYTNHAGDPLHNTDQDVDRYDSITSVPSYQLAAFMTQWRGPIPYKGEGRDKVDGFAECFAKPEEIIFGPENYASDPEGCKMAIKQLVVQYGAVACEYPTPGTTSMYHKWFHADTTATHGSAIVGWDDTVEPGNFPVEEAYKDKMTVTSPGAWIIKNSWGSAHGDGKGYFYLSYEAVIGRPIAYKMMAADTYDFNYFYDGKTLGVWEATAAGPGLYAASFEAKKGGTDGREEYLEAVNVGTRAPCTVTVEVYTNVDPQKLEGSAPDPTGGGQAVATAEGSFPFRGYYTIRLKTPIKLEPGQYFTVVVKPSAGGIACSRENSVNDLTFVTTADGGWRNTLTSTYRDVLRLKAYTKLHDPGTVADPDPTATASPEPTATATPEPTATASPSPSPTPTATPTATASPTPTATATATASASPSPTATADHPVTSEPFYTPAPSDGPSPVSPTNAPAVPDTGDGTPLTLYAGLLALCLAGLVLVRRGRRE